MGRKCWLLLGLLLMIFLSGCGAQGAHTQLAPDKPIMGDALQVQQQPTPTPALSIPAQLVPPTPTPIRSSPSASHGSLPPGLPPPNNFGSACPNSLGPDPYGSPPAMTSEEVQLTQELYALINHDRAIRNLYPFSWNSLLACGARQHSWDMVHCGFSHTCPYGVDQCTRIADEGFQGFTDCGENIALAGPYPTPWGGVYSVQESMINEPPNGWHRIHLTSTTLHRIGVGLFVDSRGWIWFTEDMVS